MTEIRREDRLLAVLVYVSPFISVPVLFPAVVYLVCRSNTFVRGHAAMAATMQAVAMVAFIVGVLLAVHNWRALAVGFYLVPYAILVVLAIRGARRGWHGSPQAA